MPDATPGRIRPIAPFGVSTAGPEPGRHSLAWLAAAVVATSLCKSPRRAFGTVAPPRAGSSPALYTRRRAAAAAPSCHSDFRDVLSVATAHLTELPPLGAPTAPQPASAWWARRPPPLRARSGPREPTARRLFGCGSGILFAARNTRPSGMAPQAAWSRGARLWEGPRGEPAAPPHSAGRWCARRASAHAHPTTVPGRCPA
jgi:hypothetical protein